MLDFSNINKIVIKIGTSSLTNNSGFINKDKMINITSTISNLKKMGKKVILVSSGAVGAGMYKLGIKTRPSDIKEIQACASVGQCELINIYDELFKKNNITISQILLTRDIIDNIDTRINTINTFNKLLEYDILPIVNENDVISTDEIQFGDNDNLSAIVSIIIQADMLIILSDIDGLFDSDPKLNKNAKIIHHINKIDQNIIKLAGNTKSNLGKGGMTSKINAAQLVMNYHIPMYILNSNKIDLIYDIFDNKKVGTLFYNSL